MRCPVHCPEGGGGFAAAVLIALAVYVLWQLAVILAVAAAVFLAVAAAAAWLSRRLCWRLSVVHWPSMEREAVNHTVMRAALPAPRRALEAPHQLVEGVIIEKEAVR